MKTNKLLILPCSSEKLPGGIFLNHKNNHFKDDIFLKQARIKRSSFYLNLLSSNKDSKYFKKRRDFKNSILQQVDDVYFKSCYSDDLKYLEAIYRYKGILYNEIIINKILEKINSGLHVLIISGLYGVLKYNDHILDYQLDIKKGGYKFWNINQINSISNAILMYMNRYNILSSDVTVILSDTYSEPLKEIISTFKENLWDKADGYGHSHIQYLDEYLSQF